MTRALVALSLLLTAVAHGEPRYVIRLGAIAPEGTGWAREVRAFARAVEVGTHGDVQVKWYLGGIAGNELEVMSRIQRGQLDGAGSAGPLCQKVAPSARVFSVVGLFQTRAEVTYVIQQLRSQIDDEARKAGFVLLAFGNIGPHVVMSRTPLRTLAELRGARLSHFDQDEVGLLMQREMGVQIVPAPLEDSARLFDQRLVDGFISVPTATLGFQWYTRAHYMLDLRLSYVTGCIAVAGRVIDRLPIDYQRVVQTAGAKMGERFEETGREQDEQLLGGVFQKQGVVPTAVSPEVRAEFLAAARAARERLGTKLVPQELIQRVLALLADYRAEHH